MSNRYLTGHFALISIILFSLSLSFYAQSFVLDQLEDLGVYEGMLEFFTEGGIKLAILFVFLLIFFMVFLLLNLFLILPFSFLCCFSRRTKMDLN